MPYKNPGLRIVGPAFWAYMTFGKLLGGNPRNRVLPSHDLLLADMQTLESKVQTAIVPVFLEAAGTFQPVIITLCLDEFAREGQRSNRLWHKHGSAYTAERTVWCTISHCTGSSFYHPHPKILGKSIPGGKRIFLSLLIQYFANNFGCQSGWTSFQHNTYRWGRFRYNTNTFTQPIPECIWDTKGSNAINDESLNLRMHVRFIRRDVES